MSARGLSVLLIAFLMALPAASAAQDQTRARVSLATAESGAVLRDIELNGSVVASRNAELSASVAGLVVESRLFPGARVSRGEVLLRLDPAMAELQLASAEASLTSARVALTEAERRRNEAQTLAERGDFSRSAQEERESAMQLAQAELERQQAEVALQRERLDRHQVRAPYDGIVSRRHAVEGEWVNPGDVVMAFVSSEETWLEFAVAQRFFATVRQGMEVAVTLAGMDEAPRQGRIEAIIPVSDNNARQFRIRVDLEDWPAVAFGSSARAQLRLPTGRDAILIPRDAINRYPEGRTTVWLAVADGEELSAREKRVQVDGQFDETIAITDGLSAGDRVVVRGNEGLSQGQLLEVIE